MKILWMCNIPIPEIAIDMGLKPQNICGWLTGFANELKKLDNIELHICFPILGLKDVINGKVGNITYHAFSQPKLLGILPVEDSQHSSKKMNTHIKKIINDVNPDILHVFGTEYIHSLIGIKEFNNPKKTVINIQGLTSFYWRHYSTGIPYKELKRFAASNIVRGNILRQSLKMQKRGIFEIDALKRTGNVIGRTDWDKACTEQVNPNVKYYYCNESLRDSFYRETWNYEKCQKHSIFMSQASYPIKGLHFVIEAMIEILRAYPDAHLYIAGNNLTDTSSLYKKLKISSYAKYIKKLINDNGLNDKITFTGQLNEEQMKVQYLKCNVFVLPSTIENSPNSLGEGMLLGIPCVAADVGGVKNLLEHEKEGYIYQCDAPYMIAFYVKKIFNKESDAAKLGENAQEHAKLTHNRESNMQRLLEIYEDILKN